MSTIDTGMDLLPVITDAKAPFDDRKADVILRSSDNIDFRVIKAFLSFASPFFESMFALPQPCDVTGSDETKDGLPVIPLEEKSGTVEKLLSYSYPIWASGIPALDTLDEVLDVLEGAVKYEMEGVEKHIRQALISPMFIEKEPMRVFAIAYRYKLADEVKIAAKHTLMLPIDRHPFVAEFDHIPASAIYQLMQYHGNCSEAAAAVATKFEWLPERHYVWLGKNWHSCAPGPQVSIAGGRLGKTSRAWWMKYMQTVEKALREKPSSDTVKREDLMKEGLQAANECGVCRGSVEEEMTEFIQLLAGEVERVLASVVMHVNF